MSGGSQQQQTGPPAWMTPYYQYALNKGQNLANSPGPQYYPGQQVAPLQPLQQAGLQSVAQTAAGPSPINNAAKANAFETSGALLNPNANPYLQGMFNQGANQIQNRLSSEFAGAGSNIANSAPVQANELGNFATSLYGNAYGQGLQAMNAAQALAPGLAQSQYLPAQELMQAGGTQQDQLQNQINAAMQKYNYQQTLPYNQLSWYSSLLGQNASPFSNTTATMHNNPTMSALGGAAAGGALGGALAGTESGAFLGPWGAVGGAALGGLMGLFGS